MQHADIVQRFSIFRSGTSGIGRWISEDTDTRVLDRLANINSDPLTKVQLNQLLVLSHEAPVSFGFFTYYWLQKPSLHLYDVTKIDGYDESALSKSSGDYAIHSVDQLYWGLYRLFVDGLIMFGNIRSAFRALRGRSSKDIEQFFSRQRFDTAKMHNRGPALPLKAISRDKRYLISEMAANPMVAGSGVAALGNRMADRLHQLRMSGATARVTIKDLIERDNDRSSAQSSIQSDLFTSAEILEETVVSEDDLIQKYKRLSDDYSVAQAAAKDNTKLYLSMVNELDVYVATSMRSRADFRNMADTCDKVFANSDLAKLNLRYFDPTMSAANGHEDKGLIECLMVKCCKALLYCAGEKDSYGKDAEAAMALSLGKPVIFLCEAPPKAGFFRDVHPLSRLINFKTGVACGALITHETSHASELLRRIFCNEMEFYLEQHPSRPGFLRLRERLTKSVVRLHTDDRLLSETFWNHYNERGAVGDIIPHF